MNSRVGCLKVPLRLLLIILLGLSTPLGRAASTVLDSCDETALRFALAAGGVVKLNCSGTIVVTNNFFISSDTVLDGSGHAVVLNGNNTSRIFQVAPNAQFTLLGLELVHGFADRGGALFNDGGEVEIRGCRFEQNLAQGQRENGPSASGGAVFSRRGNLVVIDTVFETNRADGGQIPAFTLPESSGGAIAVEEGSVALTNCAFKANWVSGPVSASFPPVARGNSAGGALYLTNAVAILEQCAFLTNSAVSEGVVLTPDFTGANVYGGAIAQRGGVVELRNCAFQDNRAEGAPGSRNGGNGSGRGGAVFSAGELMAASCQFLRNRSIGAYGGSFYGGYGLAGALYVQATADLSDCLFALNMAAAGPGCSCGNFGVPRNGDAFGGAIVNEGVLQAVACSFVSNRLESPGTFPAMISPRRGNSFGGAVYSSGQTSFTNSTWVQNMTVAQLTGMPLDLTNHEGLASGAAIYQTNGLLTLQHCTIASNLVVSSDLMGSAVEIAPGANASLRACILAGNTSTNVLGRFADLGANVSSDVSAFSAASSRTNSDPMLGPLGNYGGPTPVLPLLPGSPALDLAETTLSSDQRHVPRPVGKAADAGAVEFLPPVHLELGSDGQLQIEQILQPNRDYAIEASMDLIRWTWLGAAHSGAEGRLAWPLIELGQEPFRFFRSSPVPSL